MPVKKEAQDALKRSKKIKSVFKIPVRETVLQYSGSIEIPWHILKTSGLLPGEKITVYNRTSGAVFETYIIDSRRRTNGVRLFGPAARLGQAGDILDLVVYAMS